MKDFKDTIAAVSTPQGSGGIALIRVSGPDALSLVNSAWKGKDLTSAESHTAHLGKYFTIQGELIDEGVATVFKAPRSFTGEDVVELSVHGSSYIQRELLADLIQRGARIAAPGEFTQRAFLNGKLDLAQAEGVADLIASNSKAAHDLALQQTKGTFSKEFNILREKLIEFASLLELELDFSEEDVEFADRHNLYELCENILGKVNKLRISYSNGSVLKNGVPVVIAGIPNAGKSSLLNVLLGDEKAIVTDIPGTTRDLIEDIAEINGVIYRFIDTAGLRETIDKVEEIGVNRAKVAMEKAFIVVWLIDLSSEITPQIEIIRQFKSEHPEKHTIILLSKTDLIDENLITEVNLPSDFTNNSDSLENLNHQEIQETAAIPYSSKTGQGMQELLSKLNQFATSGANPATDIIVTNARHYEALTNASASLDRVLDALSPESLLPPDLIAQDVREALSHLSLITGSISSDTLLHSIFSRFCIGK